MQIVPAFQNCADDIAAVGATKLLDHEHEDATEY